MDTTMKATASPVVDVLSDPGHEWRAEPALWGDRLAAEMGIDWRTGQEQHAVQVSALQGKTAAEWAATAPDPTPAGLFCQSLRAA